MAYDEHVADRLRAALTGAPDVDEQRMFGGIAFMVRGNMAIGVNGTDLMVRVGPAAYEQSLSRAHAREMDFTGRPMRGFVMVDAPAIEDDTLAEWVDDALDFVLSLPAK